MAYRFEPLSRFVKLLPEDLQQQLTALDAAGDLESMEKLLKQNGIDATVGTAEDCEIDTDPDAVFVRVNENWLTAHEKKTQL